MSNLLLVPLFLHYWSPIRYGEWLVISSLAAYLGSADFGMTSAAINELTQRYCRKEFDRFVQLLHTALTVYVCFAGIVTFLGYALFTRLPLNWVGIHHGSREVGIAAALLVAQVVWYFPSSVILNFYRTIGDFHKSQWLGNLYQLLTVVVTAVGLATGAGFVRLAALQLGVPLVLSALVAALINVQHPDVALGFRHTSLKEIGPLFRTGSSFMVMTIGNTISMQGPILVVSLALGPVFVTAYSTVRTLANSVRQVVGVFTAAAWPELTVAQASGNRELARRIHRGLVIATTSLATAAGASLWFVGPQIFSAWTRAQLPDTTQLIRWFAVQVVLQAPWIASSCVSESSNRNRFLSFLYSGSAITSVVISAFAIRYFGVGAVPASIVVAELCICAHFVIKDSCKLLNEDYKVFAVHLWTRVFLLIAVASLTAWLFSLMPIEHVIPRSIVVSIGTALVVCTTAWFCWLNRSEKKRLSGTLLSFAERLAV
jgi:O-antigen/teichoic acid export membrane protein